MTSTYKATTTDLEKDFDSLYTRRSSVINIEYKKCLQGVSKKLFDV